MEPINIPLVPQWNLISGCCSTPNDGFLYIGNKTINYVSKIRENFSPSFKVFHTRQRVKCLDCDPDWTDTKYFAVLADDNSIQIWDYDDGKAIKGHRAHIKPVFGDGDGPPLEMVKLCFLKNRTVLSIDSLSIVQYCVSSNTYSKSKRIIPAKHEVSIIKGSPYDDRIFAAGTTRGLVLVVDLKVENVLYTLRGHDTEITSFSWMRIETPSPSDGPEKAIRKMIRQTVAEDDIFDIYDYDYLENEFGVPVRPKEQPSDSEEITATDKVHEEFETDNFNFVEACQNLRDEIINERKKNDDGFNDSGVGPSSATKQVTLNDCQQSEVYRSTSSFSCQSNQSLDLGDRSTTESCKEGDGGSPEPSHHVVEVHNQPDNVEEEKNSGIVYLASGSHEALVWIWNTQSGSSADKLQLKSSSQNIFVEVAWINESTILTNSRAGELMLWKSQIDKNNRLTFKQEKRSFNHRGVVSLCKLRNSDIIWTISSYREITCEDIVSAKTLAKYSCASSNICQIAERPDDMHRVAFACADRRIGVMNLANISQQNIAIENFSNKVEASVMALAWSATDRKLGQGTEGKLAFATSEGRIGILDPDKPNAVPVVMNPFCGKSIYSLVCTKKHLIACGDDKVAFYDLNGKHRDPRIITNIAKASSVSARGDFLIVGTQNGNVELWGKKNMNSLNFELLSSFNIGSKYISDISWSNVKHDMVAAVSLSNKIGIFKVTGTAVMTLEKCLTDNNMNSGNASVKWSNQTENHLLSCGFDGAVRIWDLSKTGNEMISLKQFICPMLCGIFSPLNENIIICAGKTTSIEMFDYTKENVSQFCKTSWKKNKDKPLEGVQWATKIKSLTVSGLKERKRNRKRGKEAEHNNPLDDSEIETLRSLMGGLHTKEEKTEADNSAEFNKHQGTILHLIARESNKDVLQAILNILDRPSDSVEENNANNANKLLTAKLFGTKADVRNVLDEELRNHHASRTKSFAHFLIPQLNGNLKDEILNCIQNKKLTEWHISVAPTISFDFWKKCCFAYANQLFELGHTLQAIPYLLACHDTTEAISQLLEKSFFREAWVIAKIYREPNDSILETVLDKWIEYLEVNGNLEGAALICTLCQRFQQAHSVMLKRKRKTEEHLKIINFLSKKFESE